MSTSNPPEALHDGLLQHRLVANKTIGAAVEERALGLLAARFAPARPREDEDERQSGEHQPLQRPGDRLDQDDEAGDETRNTEPEQEPAGHDQFEPEENEA